ncbi:hypothetical protein [Halobaculum sp. EA56]|uniref:hypothetical protein n=1 Tax=Halobaculum sp. EA56 TaxID=3421648 RepID=UPI003EC0F503
MSIEYSEDLHRRIQQAAGHPISDSRYRQEKATVLTEAISHPYAAARAAPSIVAMLIQASQTTPAVQMFSDPNAVSIETVQKRSVDALESIAEAQPAALANEPSIERLIQVHGNAGEAIAEDVLSILGNVAGSADAGTIRHHVLPECESTIANAEWPDNEAKRFLTTIAQILADEPPVVEPFVALLEKTAAADSPSATAAAAQAAGLALHDSAVASESLLSLLESGAADTDPVVLEGVSRGAALALSNENEEIRQSAASILNRLGSSSASPTRAAVPTGIRQAIACDQAVEIDPLYEFVSQALEDDADDVQTAAVEAAAAAVSTSEGESVDQFAELIETAVIEREGKPRATAVTALRESPVLEALASATSRDKTQITEAVERSLVSQPEVTLPESANRPRLLNASNFEIEEPTDDDEDTDADEDLSELSEEDLEERGKEIADEEVPDMATSLFESADSPERKIIVLHAVREWFESESPESLSSAAPWQTVLSGWNNSESEIQAAALTASTAAISGGHIQWETGAPLYRQAWSSIDPSLREVTLQQIGTLLNRSCITWETAREWIDPAVEDSSMNIWKEGLNAIGDGLQSGEISVADALPYIEASQSSASDIVVGYGVLALARGIQGGSVDPDQVRPLLESAVDSGAKSLATAMTATVGKLLSDSDITWEQAQPILLNAYEDERDDVAERAMKGIGNALDAEAIEWSEVESLILSTRDTSKQAVTEAAVLAVAFAMRRGLVSWETVSEYVEFARDSGVEDITHNAFRVVEIGLHEDELSWSQVEPFMTDALNSDTDNVADEAVQVITRGISEEFLSWSEVSEFLQVAAADQREEVVNSAVQAAYMTALGPESAFDWSEIRSLLKKALQIESDDVRIKCIKTAGAAMQEQSPEWQTVKAFIDSVSVPETERGLSEVMRAVTTGLKEQDAQWEEVEPYLTRGLHSGRKSVAITSVQYVQQVIIQKAVEWDEIAEFLADARTHEFTECIEESVACVGAALQHEVIDWDTAAEPLEVARSSSHDSIATESIRAVRVGLTRERIAWGEARSFLVSSLQTTPETVFDSILRTPIAAYLQDILEWQQVVDLFEEVVSTHGVEPTVTAIEWLGRMLSEDKLSWDQAEQVMRSAADSSAESVQFELAKATGAALANGAPWSQAGPVIEQRFDSGTPAVKSRVLSALSAALYREEISWESVADIFTSALASENDDVVATALEGLRRPVSADALAWADIADELPSFESTSGDVSERLLGVVYHSIFNGQADWAEVEGIVESALQSGSEESAIRAIETAGAGLQQGNVEWVDAEWLLSEACKSHREPVAREALRAVRVSLSHEVLDWGQARNILACGVESEHSAVVFKTTSAIQKALERDIATWDDAKPLLERARTTESPEGGTDGTRGALECAALATRHVPSAWDDIQAFLMTSLTGDTQEIQSAVVEHVCNRLSDGSLRWDQAEPLLRTARDECPVETAVEVYNALFHLVMSGHIRWNYIREFVTAGVRADTVDVSVAATEVVGGALQEGTVRWEEAKELLETARDSGVEPLVAESLRAISAALDHNRIAWSDAKPFILSLGLPASPKPAEKLVSLWQASPAIGGEDIDTVQAHLTAIRRCDADASLELASALRFFITNGLATPTDVQSLATDLLSSPDPFVRIRLLGAIDTYADSIEGEFEAIELLETGLTDSEVGLQDISLGILGSLVTAGAIDSRTLRTMLETALADDEPAVQTRAVEIIETAIEYERCEPALLRELLRRVVSDATAGTDARITALDTVVEHAEWLGFGEDIYDLLITTTSTESTTVRERSLELIAQLLASAESVSPGLTASLESLLWERLSTGVDETRRAAAHALARLYRLTDVSIPESSLNGLREAITEYQYPAPVRVTLVALLLNSDQTTQSSRETIGGLGRFDIG